MHPAVSRIRVHEWLGEEGATARCERTRQSRLVAPASVGGGSTVAERHVADGSELDADQDLDDVEAYISTFDDDERRDLAAAEAAIDIAILLHRARRLRGLS